MQITPITKDEARGNSRPVTRDEFEYLALIGQQFLNTLKNDAPAPLALSNGRRILADAAWIATRDEWGGITANAHTGSLFDSNERVYALTVKGDQDSVSVPIDASRAQFNDALYRAVRTFDFHFHGAFLGVFRDDDEGTIDFDPVIIVDSIELVEKVGAATHAIGGAYCFEDGNGYWPPHISE